MLEGKKKAWEGIEGVVYGGLWVYRGTVYHEIDSHQGDMENCIDIGPIVVMVRVQGTGYPVYSIFCQLTYFKVLACYEINDDSYKIENRTRHRPVPQPYKYARYG